MTKDALRRTHLANERTYLAWWRTGLTAFAVALGAGKVVPALSDVRHWPYEVLGAGFAVLGLLFIAYASWRHREVQEAIAYAAEVRLWSTILNGNQFDLDKFKAEIDGILAHVAEAHEKTD